MAAPATTPMDSPEGRDFNFRNAPIDVVLNAVLGEAYGLNYHLHSDASGTMTLRLDGITSPDAAVAGLNVALGLQGLEITDSPGGFIVAKKGQAKSASGTPVFVGTQDQLPAGSSVVILQVRFAAIDDVVSLAKALLPPGIIKHADEHRGLVLLSGEPDDVAAATRLIKSMDLDWLDAVSTAIIPIENTTPSVLASELQPVVGRLGGTTLIPLDRLQSLLVVSRNRERIVQVQGWIERFDQDARPQLMRDVLVYEARYVNAEELLALTDTQSPTSGGLVGGLQQYGYGSAPAGRTQGTTIPSLSRPDSGEMFAPAVAGKSHDALYSNLSIRLDPGRNAIVARGDQEELRSLSELLAMLDKPKRQVLIEATIVEVSLNDGASWGVQWDLIQDKLSATLTDNSSGAVTSLFPGASLSYVNTDIKAVINALATTSDVEVVSSPRLVVLNNETARLQVGDQVPIITQSAVSITDPGAPVVNSTSYRDTGVILTVTPRIRAGGMVEVDISQEVSGVSETTSSTIDSPTISRRSIQSVLAVPDGSTVVLGGLMSTTKSIGESGVPLLKDTPLIGAAFKSRNQTSRRTELVVLIEPTVISPDTPPTDIPTVLRSALVQAIKDPN